MKIVVSIALSMLFLQPLYCGVQHREPLLIEAAVPVAQPAAHVTSQQGAGRKLTAALCIISGVGALTMLAIAVTPLNCVSLTVPHCGVTCPEPVTVRGVCLPPSGVHYDQPPHSLKLSRACELLADERIIVGKDVSNSRTQCLSSDGAVAYISKQCPTTADKRSELHKKYRTRLAQFKQEQTG